MDDSPRAVIDKLLDGLDRGDISVMDEVFHDDAVMVWPASREQVVGAENRRGVYAHTAVLPKVSNRHVYGSGDLWIAEATLTYGDSRTRPFSSSRCTTARSRGRPATGPSLSRRPHGERSG